MAFPNYQTAMSYEAEYQLIPVCKEIYADDVTPITLLRKLAQVDSNYYLLESVEGLERWGRYSFLGYDPLLLVYGKEHQVTIRSGEIETTKSAEPMDELRSLIAQYRAPYIKDLPSFTGGFVGYFSYEMIGYTEPKLKLKQNDIYDFYLMLFHKVIAYDHLKQKLYIIANYKAEDGRQGYEAALVEIEKMIRLIHDASPLVASVVEEKTEFTCNMTKEAYIDMVEKTKHYIREGDIFQGVVSRRFEADYKDSLLNAYRILRTTNPSPYMYYMKCGDLEIAGSSPETLVKLEHGKLTTFPIAGSRARGATKELDEALEKELLSDAKECSEHNMLVDLARNDIGKIAEFGSVKVEDYMKVNRYSKIMHITSTVTGLLLKDKDCCDTVNAILPAGTLSGAPKFRACEIINELEPQARGIYGGAIGYIDFSGNLDVCIAIRTAVKKGNKVYVQAGAGIVADSVPELEYEETANKAQAVIDAILRASEVNG